MQGFSWIVDPHLAAMPRPGDNKSLDEDLAFLSSQGIGLLVSLTEEPADLDALTAAGIEQRHLPVADFTAPSLAQLQEFLDIVEDSKAQGRPVGVHCAAGLGRTGTFVAAYFISQGMPSSDAITKVREMRPGSVETPAQEERLTELMHVLGTSREPQND